MATDLAGQIISLLTTDPGLTDRQITDRLLGSGKPQQRVSARCRALTARGLLCRTRRPDGLIGTRLAEGRPPIADGGPVAASADPLSEDGLKTALRAWLETAGWTTTVAWGHAAGTDIVGRRGEERWIIEVKGHGAHSQARVNYFLAVLGEILQRMDDRDARYSIALPDVPQYRGLWKKLPLAAKARTGLTVLFVDRNGQVYTG